MNTNIKKIIDATPKGTGGQWISILQAEALIGQVVSECADFVQFYHKDGGCEVIAHDMRQHFGVGE